jgi:hypothetical protein
MSDHPAIVAAADQAHAEAEQTLDKLIVWWAGKRDGLNRTDEIAALTYILTVSSTNFSALLATAIVRLADRNHDE